MSGINGHACTLCILLSVLCFLITDLGHSNAASIGEGELVPFTYSTLTNDASFNVLESTEMPTICTHKYSNGTIYGNFTCPRKGLPVDYDTCCGSREYETCCKKDIWEILAANWYWVLLACVIFVLILFCGCLCCCKGRFRCFCHCRG